LFNFPKLKGDRNSEHSEIANIENYYPGHTGDVHQGLPTSVLY